MGSAGVCPSQNVEGSRVAETHCGWNLRTHVIKENSEKCAAEHTNTPTKQGSRHPFELKQTTFDKDYLGAQPII